MKKVLLVAFVAGLAMTSCKKDYTCACTYDGTTTNAQIMDAKKADAQTFCDNLENGYKVFDSAASCDLN